VEKTYWVYILSNKSKMLYTGVTNNLMNRVYQHRKKLIPGFTKRYNVTTLVYFETTHDIRAAIRREKQIKGWLRAKKLALIKLANPTWEDLGAEWFRHRGPVETLNRPKPSKRVSS
jgi:putative endonuclease